MRSGCRRMELTPYRRLCGPWEESSTSVWAGDDVYGYEFAAAPRRRTGVCRRFHHVDVAAYHHRHVAAPMSLARDGTCERRGEVSHRRPVPSLSPARPLCAPYKSGFDR